MGSESMRHIPQQARSQRRVGLILDTAAQLLAEVGYESLTTNSIAEHAGVSIGSLYRYFPDKDAIFQALAARYLEEMRALYDKLFTEDAVYLPLPVMLDRLIDPFITLHCMHPGFKQILLGADVSDTLACASLELEQDVIERIKNLLQLKAPAIDDDQAYLMAVLCKAVVKAMFSALETSTDEEFQAQVIAEVKCMLLAYLDPLVGAN